LCRYAAGDMDAAAVKALQLKLTEFLRWLQRNMGTLFGAQYVGRDAEGRPLPPAAAGKGAAEKAAGKSGGGKGGGGGDGAAGGEGAAAAKGANSGGAKEAGTGQQEKEAQVEEEKGPGLTTAPPPQ
jgi:hypothetical protein